MAKKSHACPCPTKEQMKSAVEKAGLDQAKTSSLDWKTLFSLFVSLLNDLINKAPTPTAASASDPDDPGSCDCGECLDCSICCQLHALQSTIAAKQSYDSNKSA